MSEAIASKAERLAAYNANIAAAEKDPSLSPETGKPLSKMNAARFGAGFLLFRGFHRGIWQWSKRPLTRDFTAVLAA